MDTPEKSHTFIVIGVSTGETASLEYIKRALEATHEKIIIEIEKEVVATVGNLAEAMKEDISRFVLPTPPKMAVGKYEPTPKKPKSKTKGWQRPYKYHR